ncbi:MAG: glycosyltransferase family protein [Anaerolineae bacterium]|jgi:spore coat polysaccharide biosynthesis protein SpsF|nr:glycosyltransferase family protein [Anaerolineae bacterium]MBT7076073.1 glycosyltransferase family protein [Anaerolineae bacterium]MBT7781653.1 glycosyltransferase family protein [Anaerolineae bacterium]
MKPRIIAIIQARMSSSRLPGKVLLDINGKPMLAHVIERAERTKFVDEVVLATTTDPSDDPVAEFCVERGYNFTRGSLHDVLDRYYQAATTYDAEIVVRLTADCPVLDSDIVDQTINVIASGAKQSPSANVEITTSQERVPRTSTLQGNGRNFDFVANRLPSPMGRTFPIGLDTEVCTFAALETAWQNATEKHQREHVMPYLYENTTLNTEDRNLHTGISPRGFKIALLNHPLDYGKLRWTVDTPEDLKFIREIFARFDNDDFGWKDILVLLKKEPELAKINADVHHKTLME